MHSSRKFYVIWFSRRTYFNLSLNKSTWRCLPIFLTLWSSNAFKYLAFTSQILESGLMNTFFLRSNTRVQYLTFFYRKIGTNVLFEEDCSIPAYSIILSWTIKTWKSSQVSFIYAVTNHKMVCLYSGYHQVLGVMVSLMINCFWVNPL